MKITQIAVSVRELTSGYVDNEAQGHEATGKA